MKLWLEIPPFLRNFEVKMSEQVEKQKSTCQELMDIDKPCPFEKFYDDPRHCIFHSDQIDKKRTIFEEKLKLYIADIASDPQIKSFDFTRFVFPIGIFQGMVFKKPVVFLQAKFLGNADFSQAVFHEGTNFNNCNLRQGGSFSRAKFLKEADFSEAQLGKFWFSETEFIGESIFKQARFRDCRAPLKIWTGIIV